MSKHVDRAWADFGRHFRSEALPKILSSSVTLSLIGRHHGDIDAKQAAELGALLLLDKPLILVLAPGAVLSSRLRRAADVVIEDWSPDNVDAQERLADAIRQLGAEGDS